MWQIHPSLRTTWIHLLGRWSKQQIHALAGQQVAVLFKRPRILGEIFVQPELQRIHEDGCGHEIAALSGRPSQRQVSLMERAHRWHQAECLSSSSAPDRFADATHFIDRSHDLHTSASAILRGMCAGKLKRNSSRHVITLLVVRESPCLHRGTKLLQSISDQLRRIAERPYKLWRFAEREREDIVKHQDLTVAIRPRSDPDRRNGQQ